MTIARRRQKLMANGKGVRQIIEEVFAETVTVSNGNLTRRCTCQEALQDVLIQRAMEGNKFAFKYLHRWLELEEAKKPPEPMKVISEAEYERITTGKKK